MRNGKWKQLRNILMNTICTICNTIRVTIDMLFAIGHGRFNARTGGLKFFGGWFIGNAGEVKLELKK